MSPEEAIARAQEWIDQIPNELDAFHRSCREQRTPGRFIAFEERGRDLLAALRAQMETVLAPFEDGRRGPAFDAINASVLPSGEYAEDAEVLAAWWTIHLADAIDVKHKGLVEAAGETWISARRAPFPGYAVLGAGLKRLRVEAGLTQDALATKLGISPVHVSHIEAYRRDRRAPLETVDAWAEACGRTLELGFRPAAPLMVTDLVERWAELDGDTRSAVEAAVRSALKGT